MTWQLEPSELPRLIGAALFLMIGTAIWLQAFRWPVARFLGLYMVVRGAMNTMLPFSNEQNHFVSTSLAEILGNELTIIASGAVLAFAWQYHRGSMRVHVAILVATIGLSLVYLLHPEPIAMYTAKVWIRIVYWVSHIGAIWLLATATKQTMPAWLPAGLGLYHVYAITYGGLLKWIAMFEQDRFIPNNWLSPFITIRVLSFVLLIALAVIAKRSGQWLRYGLPVLLALPPAVRVMSGASASNETELVINGALTLASAIAIGLAFRANTWEHYDPRAWGTGQLLACIFLGLIGIVGAAWAQIAGNLALTLLAGLLALNAVIMFTLQGGKPEVDTSRL